MVKSDLPHSEISQASSDELRGIQDMQTRESHQPGGFLRAGKKSTNFFKWGMLMHSDEWWSFQPTLYSLLVFFLYIWVIWIELWKFNTSEIHWQDYMVYLASSDMGDLRSQVGWSVGLPFCSLQVAPPKKEDEMKPFKKDGISTWE